jgi:hypothetical protein
MFLIELGPMRETMIAPDTHIAATRNMNAIFFINTYPDRIS